MNGGPAGPGAKPQMLVCYLCGQQFGSKSLPIHQPQCYKKKMAEWKNNPPETRGPKPQNPANLDLNAPTKITMGNANEIEDFNKQQFGDFKQQLAQCNNCGRKFLPDRLVVHLRSCKPGASGGGSKPVDKDFSPKSDSSPTPAREKVCPPSRERTCGRGWRRHRCRPCWRSRRCWPPRGFASALGGHVLNARPE